MIENSFRITLSFDKKVKYSQKYTMISTKKGQNYGITSKNSLEIPQN